MDSAPIAAPLELSLRIALCATALAVLVAVPLAYAAARRRLPGRAVVEVLVLLPLVLPPTVVGYLIIQVLGARGLVGRWLHEATDYSILFRFEGAVLAAGVVALPLIYLPAKAGFAGVEREFEDMARLFGAGRWQVFAHVALPLARRAIVSGIVLGFARALGEFGATVMVFGWQPGRLTLPVSIYALYEQGEMSRALPAVTALTIASLGLVLAYNALTARRD
jgi:molybdate transport system permease protein